MVGKPSSWITGGRFRIRTTVLSFLAVAMALVFAGAVAYQSATSAAERAELFAKRSQLLVDAQASGLASALWNMDDAAIRRQLADFRKDPDFLGARITDPESKVINGEGALDQPGALSLTANVARDGEVVGRLTMQFSLADLERQNRRNLLSSIATQAVTFVLVLGVGYLGLRLVIVPLTRLRQAMLDLAGGDLVRDVPAVERRDEVGDMARAVEVFKENSVRAEEARLRERREEEARAARARTIETLTDGFNREVGDSLERVAKAVAVLDRTAKVMGEAAESAIGHTNDVGAAIVQATANVGTAAVSADQLTASIGAIGGQVGESSRMAGVAVAEAERANRTISGLSDAARRIGDVVNLINSIASQTNLLALNATIEAARAGDAGKGFAVVAGEVKALAGQTGKATEDISNHVAAIQSATVEAVEIIKTVTSSIGRIDQLAHSIETAVEEQRVATSDIARNMRQASATTGVVTQAIGSVTEAAGKTGGAADAVIRCFSELSGETERLRRQVDGFLAKMTTA